MFDSGRKAQQQMLNDILDTDRQWKLRAHPAYAAESAKLKRAYGRNQKGDLIDVMRTRYPNTFLQLPKVVLNITKTSAMIDASVFAEPPVFDFGEGHPLGEVLDDAWAQLAECERQAMAAKSVFVRVSWDRLRERAILQPYWGHDVAVVPHPSHPGDIAHAHAVALRVASTDDGHWWEVWHREVTDDGTMGPWHVLHVSEEGESKPVPFAGPDGRYAHNVLPIVAWHDGVPDSVVLPVDEDMLSLQDDLNVALSDEAYIIAMQAHTATVYEGQSDVPMTVGPGQLLKIAPGERMFALDYSPKLDAIRERIKTKLRLFALSRRQSPDNYSFEGASVASGVARMIANEPQRKAREERIAFARRFVADLVDVLADMMAVNLPADWQWQPIDTQDFEAPKDEQERLFAAADKGLISVAQVAFRLGYYETVQAAVEAGLSDELSPPVAQPTQQSTFAQRLAARRVNNV